MNRLVLTSAVAANRGITAGSQEHKQQLEAWTRKVLAREPVVPDGFQFTWSRGTSSITSSALLLDAIMCNIQYAQQQLQRSQSMVGCQAYKMAIDAARTYSYVLGTLMPAWTFQPVECFSGLPDACHHDIYGHYCLSRAAAYSNVGKADLQASKKAQLVASSNAAHLYMVAAQLIEGDSSSMINKAQACAADVLCLWSETYLEQWQNDEDISGAAKALACCQEAHTRYLAAGHPGCQERVEHAHNRNSVYWMNPELPDWNLLVRPRITPL